MKYPQGTVFPGGDKNGHDDHNSPDGGKRKTTATIYKNVPVFGTQAPFEQYLEVSHAQVIVPPQPS